MTMRAFRRLCGVGSAQRLGRNAACHENVYLYMEMLLHLTGSLQRWQCHPAQTAQNNDDHIPADTAEVAQDCDNSFCKADGLILRARRALT